MVNSKRRKLNPKENGEQHAAADEHKDYIFLLDYDCFYKIFDLLHLEDLGSLSQTCQGLQEVTNAYFRANFNYGVKMREKNEHLDMKGYTDIGIGYARLFKRIKSLPFFLEHLKCIEVSSSEHSIFESIGTKCNKELKEIRFVGKYSQTQRIKIDESHIQKIKENLKHVKDVSFADCLFVGDFYEDFLKYCENIEHLTIDHGFDEAIAAQNEHQWLLKSYPTLNSLQWNIKPSEHLNTFLKLNPNINFTFDCYHIGKIIEITRGPNIQIDQLGININEVESTNLLQFPLLSDLRQMGLFKRMQLNFCVNDFKESKLERKVNVESLKSKNCAVLMKIAKSMFNTKEMHIRSTLYGVEIKDLCSSYPNVEILSVMINRFEDINVYIGSLSKLKALYINSISRPQKNLDVMELIKEREKLVGACKLVIYLRRELYIDMKWKSNSRSSVVSVHPSIMTTDYALTILSK